MDDYAPKHYLHPQSHAHKLAQAIKMLGTKLSTHPHSRYVHQPEPRTLTAWQRKREIARMAKARK